jgi:hypothetical protein
MDYEAAWKLLERKLEQAALFYQQSIKDTDAKYRYSTISLVQQFMFDIQLEGSK